MKCDKCKKDVIDLRLFKGKNVCIDCLSFKGDSDRTKMNNITSDEDIKKELSDIINFYGDEKQLIQVIQELSELIKEVTEKLITGITPTNIISEIADVEIMIKQLKMILAIPDYELILEKQAKIKRQINRMKK